MRTNRYTSGMDGINIDIKGYPDNFYKKVCIPRHVTAFYPTYKMMDRDPAPVATLRKAREIGLAEGLHYVYEGNIPGEGGENTYCPHRWAIANRHDYINSGHLKRLTRSGSVKTKSY